MSRIVVDNVLKTIPFPAVPIIGIDAFLQELRRQ